MKNPQSQRGLLDAIQQTEGWKLLGEHLQLIEGFSFVVVLAPDEVVIAEVREEVRRLVAGQFWRLSVDPAKDSATLAESLLRLPKTEPPRVIWVDAEPVAAGSFEQVEAEIERRQHAWSQVFALLNRYRNPLTETLSSTLVIALPSRWLPDLRRAAPDLWSIRSGLFRIEPTSSASVPIDVTEANFEQHIEVLQGAASGDPVVTLAAANSLRGKSGQEAQLASLLRRAGSQRLRRFEYDDALSALREAYELRSQLDSVPELVWEIALDLGAALSLLGQYSALLRHLQEVLPFVEARFGKTDARMASTLNELAAAWLALNQPSEAEPHLRRALAIEEQLGGPQHPPVALRLNRLATCLQARQRWSEAESLLRRAIAIDEHAADPRELDIARDQHRLGLVLAEQRKFDEAEPLLRRALAIHERLLGADHARVVRDYQQLKGLLTSMHRQQETRAIGRQRKDFLISYASPHRTEALAIYETLKDAGYSCVIDVKDFGPGQSFVRGMDDALKECERCIAVLSQEYFAQRFTLPEWDYFFSLDPSTNERRLIPVRIEDFKPEGLAKTVVYLDLVGKDDAARRRDLLNGVRQALELAAIAAGRLVAPTPPPQEYADARDKLRAEVRTIPIFGNLYAPIPMDENFLRLSLSHRNTVAREGHYQWDNYSTQLVRRHQLAERQGFDDLDSDARHMLRRGDCESLGRNLRPLAADDLFKLFPAAVICGLPGAGKTTILRHCAWQAFKADPLATVVFIEAKHLTDSHLKPKSKSRSADARLSLEHIFHVLTSLFLFRGREFSKLKSSPSEWQQVERTASWLRQEWQAGRAVLLLDALDEGPQRELQSWFAGAANVLMGQVWEQLAQRGDEASPHPANPDSANPHRACPDGPLPHGYAVPAGGVPVGDAGSHEADNHRDEPDGDWSKASVSPTVSSGLAGRCFLSLRAAELERTQAVSLTGGPIFVVNALDQEQIRTIARRQMQTRPDRFKAFDEQLPYRDDIKKVAGTPLTAMLVVFFFEAFGRFERRFKSYQLLVAFVLEKAWRRIKLGAFETPGRNLSSFMQDAREPEHLLQQPELGLQYRALAYVARRCLYHQTASGKDERIERVVSRVELLRYLKDWIKAEKHAWLDAHDEDGEDWPEGAEAGRWIESWEEENLLLPSGPQHVVFMHSTVMEFFAAVGVGELLQQAAATSARIPSPLAPVLQGEGSGVRGSSAADWQSKSPSSLAPLPGVPGRGGQTPAGAKGDELARVFDRREWDHLETLPILCSRDIETGRRVLGRLQRTSEPFAAESTLPFRCLAETELAESEELQLYLDEDLRRALEEELDAAEEKPWAYQHVVSWVAPVAWDSIPSRRQPDLSQTPSESQRDETSHRIEGALVAWDSIPSRRQADPSQAPSDSQRDEPDEPTHRVEGAEKTFGSSSHPAAEATGLSGVQRDGGSGWNPKLLTDSEKLKWLEDRRAALKDCVKLARLVILDRYLSDWRNDGSAVCSAQAALLEAMFVWQLRDEVKSRVQRVVEHTVAAASATWETDEVTAEVEFELQFLERVRRLRGDEFARKMAAAGVGSHSPFAPVLRGEGPGVRGTRRGSSQPAEAGLGLSGVERDGGSGWNPKLQDSNLPYYRAAFSAGLVGFYGSPNFKHGSEVRCVAYSPEGTRAVSGADDGLLILWDVETGRELQRFVGHGERVTCCAWSPDGSRVLSGSGDSTLKLWDAATGAELRALTGHLNWVRCCAWSADGRWVLSGSDDRSLKLWDAATGTELCAFTGHSGWVRCCALSADGRRMLSGSADRTLKLWDITTGAELRAFSGHSGSVMCCAWSVDGGRVLSGSDDRTLKLWDVDSGAELRTFTGHTGYVRCCSLIADGQWVLSGSDDRTLKLWDEARGAELRAFTGHSSHVHCCARSMDGGRVLSGSADSTLKLWDAATGVQLRTFTGHSGYVRCCSWSAGGGRVLSGSADRTLKLWDAETGAELCTLLQHGGDVTCCAWTEDGERVLSGSEDGTVKLWDVATGAELRTLRGHLDYVMCCALSADGKWVLSGSGDRTVKLWDAATGAERRVFTGHAGSVMCCSWSMDSKWMVSGSEDKTLKLWDAATGAEIRALTGHSSRVRCCAWSADGGRVLSGSADRTLKLWDAATGAELRAFTGHSGGVRCCAWSSDDERVLSGSRDKTVKLWDVASGQEVGSWNCGWTVYGVAFHPKLPHLVLAALANGTLALIDTRLQ